MARKILVRLVGTLTCMAAVAHGLDAEARGWRSCRRACCYDTCATACYTPCAPVCAPACAPACETSCVSYSEPRCVAYRDACGICRYHTVSVQRWACSTPTVIESAACCVASTVEAATTIAASPATPAVETVALVR